MSQSVFDLTTLTIKQRALLELRLRERRSGGRAGLVIERLERDNCQFPLSSAQKRLWFLHQLDPASTAYNVFTAFRLEGFLDIKSIEWALNEVTRRHEVLRTTFPLVGEQPVQQVAPHSSITLRVSDLGNIETPDCDEMILRKAREEAQRPFDLARGPLLRVGLIKAGPDDHILLICLHHIISDGWSVGILLREIVSLYEARIEGDHSSPEFDEPPIQYVDYAVWEERWLESDKHREQLEYWRSQLSDLPGALELPAKGPRPAMQSSSGSRFTFALPVEVAAGLKAMSEREEVTLFMTALSAFMTLLHRYTGQHDIVVGTPIAGRQSKELEGLIGVFINMLALRADLYGDPSFETVLRRVREVTLQAYAHQNLSFERLIEELHPVRNLSYSPLFQVTFSLQTTNPRRTFRRLKASQIEVDTATSKYDLSLMLVDSNEGLRGTFTYNTDIFEPSAIARMASHFRVLLAAIVANPQQRISELPLLTASERRLIADQNDTTREYSRDCLHHLFEQQAARTPDAVAIIFENERVNYRSLNERANLLAHHLRSLGVGPESLVGICMDRSVDMLVAMLGTLKAGGAYVPLDPDFPRSRLAFMLEDSGAPVLVTRKEMLDLIPESHARIVCVDSDLAPDNNVAGLNPDTAISPDNLAYVIYTSGSTGRPKGVQISHRALVNFIRSMGERPGLTKMDRLIAVTTLSFDIAALELLLPLTVGAGIEIVTRAVARDGNRLQDKLNEADTTVMQATPSTWRLLLESGWPGNRNLKILCGGESLSPELAAELAERGESLWNMYGPTETTIWSACDRIAEGRTTVTIGRPIANTQIYVLDSHLSPTPAGVCGELYVGGAGLARGYLGRAALTAERFIPNPFTPGGDRLYQTGDLARYLPDGRVQVVGRTDQQVKLRGFRIELGEIEAALRRCEGIREAVVVVSEEGPGDKRLIAYVVSEPAERPHAAFIRRFLRESLPDHMVPSVFMHLDELPLTPNGKIDRRALPSPEQASVEMGRRFQPPRTAVELQLTQVWSDLLQVRSIGITDNFFELGGHSLLAKRLMIRIGKSLGRELPLTAFFEDPTIEGLAARLGGNEPGETSSVLVTIQAEGTRPPFFCVHSIGGDVMRFHLLAQALGNDQPFYAFQAPHPSELEDQYLSMEEMATGYVAAMRNAKPRGPYLLGGYSFGSAVAFEMAQQLSQAGEEVALLALLDGTSPLVVQSALDRSDAVILAGFARDLARLSGAKLTLPHQKIQKMGESEGIDYILDALRTHDLIGADTDADYFLRFLRGLRVRNRALKEYRPSRYGGTITLFRSTEIEAESAAAWRDAGVDLGDAGRGWDRLTERPLEIYYVPGHHATMMSNPHVGILAERLDSCLARAGACAIPLTVHPD